MLASEARLMRLGSWMLRSRLHFTLPFMVVVGGACFAVALSDGGGTLGGKDLLVIGAACFGGGALTGLLSWELIWKQFRK